MNAERFKIKRIKMINIRNAARESKMKRRRSLKNLPSEKKDEQASEKATKKATKIKISYNAWRSKRI